MKVTNDPGICHIMTTTEANTLQFHRYCLVSHNTHIESDA